MPTLIPGGPSIPEEILKAREEGKLVFFCGAGVSMTAGLPSFKDLVERVRQQLNIDFSDAERKLFARGDYDRVLGALERRIVTPIRPIVQKLLEHPPRRVSAAHAHLMQLACSPDGSGLRLATTNFDVFFEGDGSENLIVHAAPALPPPSRDRWWGLVYLHGKLGNQLDDLVLTSADFGRAYMVEGWASRFVARLFQNFTVLFVGYGINDVIMRYLVDGIAAARKSGEPFTPPYALVPSEPDEMEATRRRWLLEDVEAIPYACIADDHRALYDTIATWADLARSGLTGRKACLDALVRRCHSPIAQTDSDEFKWLVDEPTGKVATVLRNASSSVEALELLCESGMIGRFMSAHSPPLAELNAFELEIISWIASHVSDPDLVAFLLINGPLLHSALRHAIERNAREPAVPEACRRVLACVTSEAFFERTLARRSMRSWRTMLEGPIPVCEIMGALAPVPVLRPGSWKAWREIRRGLSEPDRLMTLDLVDVEVRVMTPPGLLAAVLDRCRQRSPTGTTAEILDDLTSFLKEAIEWHQYFTADSGGELLDGLRVRSVAAMVLPRYSNEALEVLVYAVCDSFKAALQHDVSVCDGAVARWCGLRQRLFHRLVLFAAQTCPERYARRGFELVTRDGMALLCDSPAEPEVLTYLERAASALNAEDFALLLRAVTERVVQNEDGARERLERMIRSADSSGLQARVSDEIRANLHSMCQPEGKLQPSRRRDVPASSMKAEEVLAWLGNAEASSDEARRQFHALAVRRPRSALRLAIRARHPERLPWFALEEMLTQLSLRAFPARYRQLLLGWIECRLGDHVGMRAAAGTIAFFLQKFAEHEPVAPDEFWKVWDALWDLIVSPEGRPLSFQRALNDDAGRAVAALHVYVGRRDAEGTTGLRPEIARRLTTVLAATGAKGISSKTVLASFAFALYQLDPDWTRRNIVGIFEQPLLPDSLSIWDGFLFYPEYDATFAEWLGGALHRVVERAADSTDELASPPRRFFVALSLELPAIVTATQTRSMLQRFEAAGLADAIDALAHLLRVGEPDILWRTHLARWFERCWPRDESKRSDDVTRQLAELVLLLHNAFPEAVVAIRDVLRPVEAADEAVAPLMQLKDLRSDLIRAYPGAALELLSRLVTPHARIQRELSEVLELVQAAAPTLARDARYLRLENVLSR